MEKKIAQQGASYLVLLTKCYWDDQIKSEIYSLLRKIIDVYKILDENLKGRLLSSRM
jgi:hypothetical protein